MIRKKKYGENEESRDKRKRRACIQMTLVGALLQASSKVILPVIKKMIPIQLLDYILQIYHGKVVWFCCSLFPLVLCLLPLFAHLFFVSLPLSRCLSSHFFFHSLFSSFLPISCPSLLPFFFPFFPLHSFPSSSLPPCFPSFQILLFLTFPSLIPIIISSYLVPFHL